MVLISVHMFYTGIKGTVAYLKYKSMIPFVENEIVKEICRGPDFETYAVKNSRAGDTFIRVLARIDSLPSRQIKKFVSVCDHFKQAPCKYLPQFLSLDLNEISQDSREKNIGLTFQAAEGMTLQHYLSENRPDLSQALQIICQIAESLGVIHKTGIFIGTLSPFDNIYIRPGNRTIFITGFGPFSMHRHPVPACDMSGLCSAPLSGTKWNEKLLKDPKMLPYISPELTGRLNHLPDFRSDFYTLGILLYELLAARPPFIDSDPLKLIHSHIAKNPPSFKGLDLDIPQVIWDMVEKLLSKRPEDRYQNAQGIISDLAACLNYLKKQGCIPFFPIGRNDVCSQFKISDTVYGRQNEIALLKDFFYNTVNGKSPFLLIRGYSGIGKTTLVRQFESELKNHHGHRGAKVQFVRGKSDIHKRQKPYGALIEALQKLILNILTRDEQTISAWRQKITNELGINVNLITGIIPEAKIIFGPQPPVRVLNPEESKNRFQLTVMSFLRMNCSSGHPLIFFLDDLQWVDKGSLNLIGRIYDAAIPHLFFIGAFRENEVDLSHPLSTFISDLESGHGAFNQLSLQPLTPRDVTDLIKDTVNQDQETAASLANLLNEKTAGNPYYLKLFLDTLHADNLLSFSPEDGKWHWRHQELINREVTENVADLTSIRLWRMDEKLREILSFAACLGSRFDLLTLSTVMKQSIKKIVPAVREFVQHRILIPVCSFSSPKEDGRMRPVGTYGSQYRFSHDRIHDAAYRLISDKNREKRHLKIGERWYKKLDDKELARHIFEITTHFNYGRRFVADETQRRILVALNQQAAQRSKNETAFESQFHYLKICLEFLDKDCWATQYDLALSLYSDAVEATYLCGFYQEMDLLLSIVFYYARTDMDAAGICNVQIRALRARGRLEDAVRSGLDMLKKMGIDFPAKPAKHHVAVSLAGTLFMLSGDPCKRFGRLPVLSDPKMRVILNTMSVLLTCAYFVSPYLSLLITFKQLFLSRSHGLTKYTPAALAGYGGFVLCGMMENPEKGYQYGRLALSLIEKLDAQEQKAKVLVMVYVFINHWKNHVKSGFEPLDQAYRAGMETGDFEFAALSKYVRGYHAFFAGKNLMALEKEFAQNHAAIKALRQIVTLKYNGIYWQFVQNLMGLSDHPVLLKGKGYFESDFKEANFEIEDKNEAAIYYHTKFILTYLFYDDRQAVGYLEKSEAFFETAIGTLGVPLLHFYGALACLRAAAQADRPAKRKLQKKAGQFCKKLKKWARHAPVNHKHKYLLVKAEQAKISGDKKKAAMLYEESIAQAQKNEYINEEALAWELAGAFYHAGDNSIPAQVYLEQAVDCYRQWGAHAKVKHLKSVYPFLTHSENLGNDITPQALPGARPVDLSAIIKASEAISGEIVIQRLMEKLMDIVFIDAGVRKAGLVTGKADDWGLSALVSLDDLTPFSPVPLAGCRDLPVRVIQHAVCTGENLVLDHAAKEKMFADDVYVLENNLLSVLAIPFRHQRVISGVLYLENDLTAGAFTRQSVDILQTVARILANAWARNKAEEEILAYQDRLRELSSQLLLIEEQERRQLALALHDRIGHALSSALMKLEKLPQSTGLEPAGGWDEIRQLLNRSIEDTRHLTFALSPPILYDLGLSAALDWLAEQTYQTHQVKVGFSDDGQSRALDEKLGVLIFQCVRELLANVVKHAKTQQAALSMGINEEDLWVTVADKGVGFDFDKIDLTRHRKKGLGLFAIRERLGTQGGYMDVETAPGKGSRITLVVPAA